MRGASAPGPASKAPCASRVPSLKANDVTSSASAAFANSTTPRHWARVSTPPKPGGGDAGDGGSESWNQVEFAQVPLTRTYAGPRLAASARSRGLPRSTGARVRNSLGSRPPMEGTPVCVCSGAPSAR